MRSGRDAEARPAGADADAPPPPAADAEAPPPEAPPPPPGPPEPAGAADPPPPPWKPRFAGWCSPHPCAPTITATTTPITRPSTTMRTRMSKALGVRQPVGDQGADLVSLVFLHEVTRVVDDRQLLGVREQRLDLAAHRLERQHGIGVSPHQQHRALVHAQCVRD